MCLDRVLQTFDPPLPISDNWLSRLLKLNVGYKAIWLGAQGWESIFRKTKHPYNTWVSSTNETLKTTSIFAPNCPEYVYESGFHFFTNKRDAFAYAGSLYFGDKIVVVPIKYRGVVAYGEQCGFRCLVAKEIFVKCPI